MNNKVQSNNATVVIEPYLTSCDYHVVAFPMGGKVEVEVIAKK